MDDKNVMQHIDELAREEHALFEQESRGKSNDVNWERLRQIQALLDQWWDLRRQRRASQDE